MPGIGIGIGLNRLRLVGGNISPTNLTASFDIPTISGQVSWVDNSGGKAQYEVYSSYNGNPYVFLGTTLAGATSYIDTTCKQNASVVYKIRAKRGSIYSDYVSASALATPLCWKTDQSTLTAVAISTLSISVGKTVTVNWGDGTNQAYTGINSNITKNYAKTGQYNIWLSGDINSITSFILLAQTKFYGNLQNWIINYSSMSVFTLNLCAFTGDMSNFLIPQSITNYSLYGNNITGKANNISTSASAIRYRMYSNALNGSNISVFRVGMTELNIKDQSVIFPTSEIDKLLKAAADWYQLNPPTDNCTYNLSGANMGIPTDGVSNVDIVRLIGYYTAAGFAATVLVRTS
jgi:hypothetical protein